MLIELLREGAKSSPELPLIVSSSGTATYAETLRRAELLAGGLQQRAIRRFGCVVDDVAELVALLSASTITRSEACVYPATVDSAAAATLAMTFDHPVVITDRASMGDVGTLRIEELGESVPLDDDPPPSAPTLILTTGTTGHPRGARHDWSRLAGSVRHPDDRSGARWFLTYNLNQFAGIQVLLHVLLSKATLVVPATRRPRDVVSAIRDEGVTHASGTPTFWRLVLGQLTPDEGRSLPLRQITLGGEAVTTAVLDDLAAVFPDARISQIYAATEFGSGVSVRDGRPGLPASLLDRGEDADVQLRIVGGELHVRTRIGMLGFHGEADLGDGWRGTGDLVELHGDRILFVGRSSEVINVGGVKVHPLPVEELVSAIDGVVLVRAYGRPNPITGQIVAVDLVAETGADRDAVEREVRRVCRALPRACQPRVVRFVEEMPTLGQKLVRGKAALGTGTT